MEPVLSPTASTGCLESRYHKQCWVDSHAGILAPDIQGFQLSYDLKQTVPFRYCEMKLYTIM